MISEMMKIRNLYLSSFKFSFECSPFIFSFFVFIDQIKIKIEFKISGYMEFFSSIFLMDFGIIIIIEFTRIEDEYGILFFFTY